MYIISLMKLIETFYLKSTVVRLCAVKEEVLQLEPHPFYFLRSSRRHSIFANRRYTAEECTEMAKVGFVSAGNLLQRSTQKYNFFFNLNLTEKIMI